MIHVIATIQVAAGKRAAFLEQFNAVVPAVRAEDGCLEYGATIDTPTPLAIQEAIRPDVAVIVEKWASVAHLQAHLKAPHMDTYRERVKDLVTGVSLQVLEPMSP